ncbi:recombination protein F [Sedimentisphaera cyanobacteriorum]|uniref:Recombination protein F n=1 Tax=Sedimentisphaera cyanobacteriorum TaxID=1940790 RepID=A0A1Q2HQ22_9BACT|nr:ATP-binding protein [Sedimentisphaera cyanobacteriorum]AQQ09345.1 recombination protein F [Sedimentisphaera cyanobacteriorum]
MLLRNEMILNAQINNFKALKNISVSDIGRVNLFVGNNSSGKSTLLEALYLASSSNPVRAVIDINNFRGISQLDKYPWDTFFTSFNTKNEPQIKSEFTEKTVTTQIEPFLPDYRHIETDPEESFNSDYFSSSISGLTLNISEFDRDKNRDGRKSSQTIKFDHKEGNDLVKFGIHGREPDFLRFTSSLFITGKANLISKMPHFITNLKINKQLDAVIEILKNFSPSVNNLEIGSDSIYVDIGESKLYPIGVMGDGFVRFLAISLAIISSGRKVILIDEIDTGLHYSAQFFLWEAILKLAENNNVQIMAVTHSIDCISSFAKAGKKSSEKTKMYRLEKEDDKNFIIDYNVDEIQSAIEKEYEMR